MGGEGCATARLAGPACLWWGGGSGPDACTYPLSQTCTPPRPPCCMSHVHAGDAVPGTLSNLQHSLAPSRARNPRAMRVDVVAGGACSPDGSCLGMTVHPLLPLCTLVLRKQQRCWLVNLSAVFLWCLVACETRVAVSLCRS